ncbi:MAG TPA: pyridoxal-phosphate dependent enzyme [Candidatus Acidoferrales bacterium]|nr:pyridoxal-phosphate dependent enzyme [Candidatus Acidoferrales bacterium]
MLEHAMGIDDIQAAARLPGRIHRTPVITVRSFDERCGHTVFFKCENLQRAGAFKIRGALNKLLTLIDEERRRGVTGFSSGKQKDADRRSPRLRRGDRGRRSLPPSPWQAARRADGRRTGRGFPRGEVADAEGVSGRRRPFGREHRSGAPRGDTQRGRLKRRGAAAPICGDTPV